MIASIREDTVRMILTVKVRREEPPQRQQVLKPAPTPPSSPAAPVNTSSSKKVGRNDPCPCGSGKKYKKCCGADE